jgi:hypothetical protein
VVNPSEVLKALQNAGVQHKPSKPSHQNPNIVLQTKPSDAEGKIAVKGLLPGDHIMTSVDNFPAQIIHPNAPVRDINGHQVGIAVTAPKNGMFEMVVQGNWSHAQTAGQCVSVSSPEDLMASAAFIAEQIKSLDNLSRKEVLDGLKQENAVLHALVMDKWHESQKVLPVPGGFAPTAPTGPVVPPLNPIAVAKAQQKAQAALAKKIQSELVAHQATGAPLSPEAQKFVEEYEKIHGPWSVEQPKTTTGPSTKAPPGFGNKVTPQAEGQKGESRKQFLDRLGRRNTRKLSRRKSTEEE